MAELIKTNEITTSTRGEGTRRNATTTGKQKQTTTQTPGIRTTVQEESGFKETTLVRATTSTSSNREESPARTTTTTNGPKSSVRTEAAFTVTQTRNPSETVQVTDEDAIIKLAFTLQVRRIRKDC